MNKPILKQKFKSNDGNCLIYGCASLVVIGIIAVVMIGFGARYFISQVKEQYTDNTPIELTIVDVSDAERDAIIDRVDTWLETLEHAGEKVTLTLTERDINVLIQHHKELKPLNGLIYVSINDSTITGDVSIPLENIPGFSDRYFNGSADFEIDMSNGKLSVYATSASLKGESVPDEIMQQVSNENLAKDVNNDRDIEQHLEHIESIEVKDGILTMIPKGVLDTPTEEESATIKN